MKHDWERSKSEVSIKIPKLVSLCLYILSNALFIYFAFSSSVDISIGQDLINRIIIVISLLSIVYFLPSILKYIYGFSNRKHEIGFLIFIYLLTGLFYVIYFCSKERSQFGILNFPIFIQAISILINSISDLYDCERQIQYAKTLEKRLPDFEKNDNKGEKINGITELNNKNKMHKKCFKNHSIKEMGLLPLRLMQSIVKLLWQFLLFLIQLIANIFSALINITNRAIEYIKNVFDE